MAVGASRRGAAHTNGRMNCTIKERIMRGRQVAPLLHGACEPKSTAAGVNEAQCLLQLLVHLVALL